MKKENTVEEMTIGLGFTIPFNKMLDKLVENNYKAEIGNISIKYIGEKNDKQVYEIVRTKGDDINGI